LTTRFPKQATQHSSNNQTLPSLITLLVVLSLWIASCQSSSPEPTDTVASPTTTPPPARTATSTAETSPIETMGPITLPTPTPTVVPSPTATTETSPLPAPMESTVDASDLAFDGDSAYNFVLDQVALGPRPTGSEAGWATGEYIIRQLASMGWEVIEHPFTYSEVKGRNIIGKRGTGPVAMLGAHYDTRPYADHNPESERDQWILGANDGGSGVAVLLELARILEVEKTEHEIWLAFFDAEDRGNLDGWPFSVGATVLAQALSQSELPELPQTPEFVIVVDMVGDDNQQLHYEGFSDPQLNERLWMLARSLGYESYFIPAVKHWMIDDHRPFLDVGMPAIDIIDFDYPYWHTTEDTGDKVDPASLERVGQVLELFLETGGSWQ
jgi:glutaminyl-peptide cyclotransferase